MNEEKKTIKYILIGFAIVLLIAVLKIATVFTLTITLSLFCFFLVNPLLNKLSKKRVNKYLSVIIVMIILLFLLFFIAWIMIISINMISKNYNYITDRLDAFNKYLSKNIKVLEGKTLFESFNISYKSTISKLVVRASSVIVSLLGSIVLIFIFVFFLLIERNSLIPKFTRAFPNKRIRRLVVVFERINRHISRYLFIKSFISLITGVLFFLTAYFANLRFPILWGLLAFMFNFIPNIGSVVITIGTTLMATLQFFPNWSLIISIFFALTSIQVVVGNILDPQISGIELNLSPFVVLVSLLFWGYVWGIAGMFLAVPITSSIQIVCAHIKSLNPIAIILSSGKLYRSEYEQKRRELSLKNRLNKIKKQG